VKAAIFLASFFFFHSTYFPFRLEGFSQVTNINSIITSLVQLQLRTSPHTQKQNIV